MNMRLSSGDLATTINEAMTLFDLEQQLRGNQPKTLVNYTKCIKQFDEFCASLKITLIEHVTLAVVNRYHIYLRGKEHHMVKGQSLRQKTIQTYLRHLKVFFRYCYESEFMSEPVYSLMRLPKAEKPTIEILTNEEIEMMFSACNQKTEMGARNIAIMCLMLDSGLRKGEVENMKYDDINFQKGYASVTGKGMKGRIVPVGAKTRKVLLNYIYKRRKPDGDDCEYFFLSRGRQKMNEDVVKNMFNSLKEKT